MECLSGVKTAQNVKTEGGIERKKKHENVKLKEEDVPGAILLREKPEECAMKELQRWLLCRGAKTTGRKKRSSYKGMYAWTGKLLKLFLHKNHSNLHVSS